MINNNHKDSGCGRASELVSYLYGETSAAENTAFEKHLAACSSCADELEAFSGVQFSITDWKTKDFEKLQTPLIEIPYPAAPSNAEVQSIEDSWFSKVRKLFSPSWSLAAASLAIFAVCVGIIFYALKSPDINQVAINNSNAKIAVSPTVEKPAEISNTKPRNLPDTNPEEKQIDKPQSELTIEQNSKNNRAVKTVSTQRRTQKSEPTNLPKNNNVMREPNKNKNDVTPKIFDEDEEDETLRLAEMLEEVGTVE